MPAESQSDGRFLDFATGLVERGYTPDMISSGLGISQKRAEALVNEIKRRQEAERLRPHYA